MKRLSMAALVMLVLVAAAVVGSIHRARARAQALEPDAMPPLAAAMLRGDVLELEAMQRAAQPLVQRVVSVCKEFQVHLLLCGNCDGHQSQCDQVDTATGKINRANRGFEGPANPHK